MERQKLEIDVEKTSISGLSIDAVLSCSKIPKGELHVLKGSNIAGILNTLKPRVSLALVANSIGPGIDNYAVGYEEALKIVLTSRQATPLVVNAGMVAREKQEFRDNEAYRNYRICIIAPPVDIFTFLRTERALAPYATAPQLYKPAR
ncbi:hypothetical protein HY642_06860 [Candidatus Woesearchaeota archaeon]|nr:hypothetical protein [Candidatus Woesearchaeota archaeon]